MSKKIFLNICIYQKKVVILQANFFLRMSRRLWLFLCWLPLVCHSAVYTPQTVPDPKERGRWEYVANPDGIVSQEDVRFLNACAKTLQDSTGVELCVAALGSIGGMEMFDFTYQLFQTWGIGGKGKNTGVLVCFVLDSHDIRIMTGTGIEGVLPDAVCNRIIQDEMIPLFREEKYGKGLCYGAMRIYEVCTDGEAPEELRNMQSVTDRAGYGKRTEDDWAGIIPLIVLCFGGLGLFVWAVVRGQYRRCPKCGKRKSRVVREQVVAPATYAKAGTGVRTYVCKNCGHSHTMPFTIPRRQRTVYIGGVNRGGRMGGGGGFSGGGSWGGGSTFGGGAGGKW